MHLKPNKVMSLLSIAMKGRNIVSGEFQTMDAVKMGKAWLVIVAEDASDNTKKLFSDKCSFYEVPIVHYGTKEELGRAIGKDLRSSVAICDEGLSKAVIAGMEKEKLMETENEAQERNGGKHGES